MIDTIKTDFGKRYKVLEEIGSGGMGRVYKVVDNVRNQELALKEMSRNHVDSSSAQLKFKNEFRIMSEFQHPDTVKVYDFGISPNNIPYITMEYVLGKNLSQVRDLSVDQVINLLVQICKAAGYIHSRLYVHRDLKPDNIKLLKGDTIKLLDYGLISQIGTLSPGKLSGTAYYIAPEVITGGIIDESTDLYSIGIIGYELLTGKRPFTGTRKEILAGHLKKIPVKPSKYRSDIPASLDDIIMKLLEKDKENRYRNTSQVVEDLRFLIGKTVIIDTVEQKQGYLYSSKLIGRESEIETYEEALSKLSKGISSSLFAGAPAGIGKTRLLNEMKTLAELQEINTIFITSKHAGEKIYGAAESLIHQLLPLSEKEEIQNYGGKISGLFEEVGNRFDGEPQKGTEAEIFESIVDWCSSVSMRHPLVIFVDDLQWTDLNSLKIINEIIRNGQKSQILFVSAFRNNEVDKASPIWHTVEEGLSLYLEPKPFDKDQTQVLLNNLLYPTVVSDDFLDFCFKNSGGNVFDLIELLRHLIATGYLTKAGNKWLEPVNLSFVELPANIEERMLFRIKKLQQETRILAEAASVLEDILDLENWQSISDCGSEVFYKSIDELMYNQVMIKTNGIYRFGHDKIRTVLYNSLNDENRKIYHKKVAEFLESKAALDHKDLLFLIADHFISANDSKAIDYCLKAAASAEENNAEWVAFNYYRRAVKFLEKDNEYPNREEVLLDIYNKAAKSSSAAWIDAATCLGWIEKAMEHYTAIKDMEKVFGLSLSYIVNSAITSNFEAARKKIPEIIDTCQIKEGTLQWAIFHGAGVCLVDWYTGWQNDCFQHACEAISIFEKHEDNLPADVWPAYSWAIFWRDKARAYLGKPIVMENIERIRQMKDEGKSDLTIYWHTLTAVGARAALSGRYSDMVDWKHLAAKLSRDMGKIHWYECWISHSYLYAALDYGDFSQVEDHIERVLASPDPYQVRLGYLFRGRYDLIQGKYKEAEESLKKFMALEAKTPDNSLLEGYVYLAKTYLVTNKMEEAVQLIDEGFSLSCEGKLENPLYRLQFLRLKGEVCLIKEQLIEAEKHLNEALSIAEQLDNPLQKGFVFKTLGLLEMNRDNTNNALNKLKESEKIFLSLGNKYQAGLVKALIDPLIRIKDVEEKTADHYDSLAKDVDKDTMHDEDIDEQTGDEGSIVTDLELPISQPAGADSETDVSETDLEKTQGE